MLLTERREIDIFLPTSVQESAESILTLAADAEETHLLPILGRPLFDHVDELYQKVILDDKWFLPQNGKETPSEQKLIRLCQEVVVYMTLADNAGLFSVSLNDAGLNTPSSQGYEEADEKRIDRFVKDSFKKGHRAIDRLLLFLEEDALGKDRHKFTELWKSSRYFHENHDTLFTTAVEFNRYVNIDESREWFVKLLPDIRFCQDTYLAPQVGYTLMDMLVKSLTQPSEGLSDKDAACWGVAVRKLRQALALHVEARNEKLKRKNSRGEADLCLERAKDYIRNHQSVFKTAMEDSPLYDKTLMGDAVSEDSITERPKHVMNYDPDEKGNSVHAIFHFNRIP